MLTRFISKLNPGIWGIGFGVMALGMIWSIVNTALASIQKDLSANVLELQWMMNAFGIFICVPMLTMGKLGDAYGRRRLFVIGLTLALLASLIAGFATNIVVLILCMGLFGLAGSIILPLSQALLVHQFPEQEKEKAVGLWSIFVSISLASGPLVGGLILNFLDWHWIYRINVPIFIIVIPLVIFFIKKDHEPHVPHCDWAGVALLAMIVCPLIIAIMQGPKWGWGSIPILSLLGLCILSFFCFIYLEKKTKTPIFRPDLFAHPSFLFSSIPNACMIGIVWIVFFMIPLYLQNIRAYKPLNVALLLLLITIPMALLSTTVSKWYRKWGARPLMLTGFALLMIAALLQSQFVHKDELWPIWLGCLAIGLGWVFVWGPSISCALSSIPHKAAGIASGMFNTLQELGAVTSLAIAGVFLRLSYARFLAPHQAQIDSTFQNIPADQTESLLTNPTAAISHVGVDSPILPFLREGFLNGYASAFWFVFILSVLALTLTFFLPRSSKT